MEFNTSNKWFESKASPVAFVNRISAIVASVMKIAG